MEHDALLTRLFFAVPEALFDQELMAYLTRNHYITQEGQQFITSVKRDKARVQRILSKTSGRPMMTRLMAIAPELMTVNTVNILRRFNYIDESQGHVLRMAIRGVGVIRGGNNDRDIIRRAGKLLGVGYSEEMIGLLRSMDVIDKERANSLRHREEEPCE